MRARYTDGLTAQVFDVEAAARHDAFVFILHGAEHIWPWSDIRRADDFLGPPILRREPDAGERVTLNEEIAAAVREAAPALFKRPRTPWLLIAGLSTTAASLAALFLFALPMLAHEIAPRLPPAYTRQLSQLAQSQVDAITSECAVGDVGPGHAALLDLLDRLAAAADVPRESVYINLVSAPFANAFAMPDGTIVVTDKLIAMTDHPDELAGVLAHELAHVKQKHVIANVIRQMGFGAFVDIVLGGGGIGQAAAAGSVNLAALRYSRDDEAEADRLAVDYLDRAGLDPGGMSRFLVAVDAAARQERGLNIPELLSTHPEAARRAAELRRFARPGRPPSLNAAQWAAVRAACAAPEVGEPPPPEQAQTSPKSSVGPQKP
ncbi:MAG: M48 family metallopeptidase [Hyphomonadaceae bacterium]